MNTELFNHALGLVEPWTVSGYDIDESEGKITFFVEHKNNSLLHCEQREKKSEIFENLKIFSFDYLNFFQYKCCISVNIPVVRHTDHGEELADFYMKPNEHTIFCPISSEYSS
ncbi:hypothetical protein DSECCO2_173280 [anaerobic digester metagenome]